MQVAKTAIRLLRSTRPLSILERFPFGSRAFAQSALCSTSTYLDKQEVADRVLNLLRSSPFIDPARVGSTADFKKDLQLDMLDGVQIMEAAEDEFAIKIPNSEANKISNTSQLIEYIAADPQAK